MQYIDLKNVRLKEQNWKEQNWNKVVHQFPTHTKATLLIGRVSKVPDTN